MTKEFKEHIYKAIEDWVDNNPKEYIDPDWIEEILSAIGLPRRGINCKVGQWHEHMQGVRQRALRQWYMKREGYFAVPSGPGGRYPWCVGVQSTVEGWGDSIEEAVDHALRRYERGEIENSELVWPKLVGDDK